MKTDDMRREHRIGIARKLPEIKQELVIVTQKTVVFANSIDHCPRILLSCF